MQEGYLASRQRRFLLGRLGIDTVCATEILTCRRRSQVERLHLPGNRTVIYKTMMAPFPNEHTVLRAALEAGMPVPEVLAVSDEGMLGMLLTDLGTAARTATPEDVVRAAAHLHTTPPPAGLQIFDTAMLASLPRTALDLLEEIQTGARGYLYAGAGHVHRYLCDLAKVARIRAEGAELAPFGFVHGDMYSSAVHVGHDDQRHVLDFTTSHIGSGLLDLVPWPCLREPARSTAAAAMRVPTELAELYLAASGPPWVLADTRKLIELYVAAGGPPEALSDRGGLPVEVWTVGWHRLRAAHWLLGRIATGVDTSSTDEQHLHLLGCLLACASTLFCR